MDEDMGLMFNAVNSNYQMEMQYKFAWNAIQYFRQFRDQRIWKNFTYFIDWMEENFTREYFYEVMGKSYDLEDNVLCRIPNEEQRKDKLDTWLMSNIYRYAENPRMEEFPEKKYTGKVRFTKIHNKASYEGEKNEQWTPPRKNKNGDDIEERKSVVDIEIVVYLDDDMKIPRRFELEHGWKDEWIEFVGSEQAPKLTEETEKKYNAFKEFEAFKKIWTDVKKKFKVPSWYLFNPDNPNEFPDDHNMMKIWDRGMFNYLKEEKWMQRKSELDAQGRNQYVEKSEFVVDCRQLLGIGGEGILIRKNVKEKVGKISESQKDRVFEALKIIPIMKHTFEDDDKIEEMERRVAARHAGDYQDYKHRRFQERKFVETYMKTAENLQMTDEVVDQETEFKNETEFKHESLMEFSNIQLDFIKVFGQKFFIMMLG